MYTRYFGFNEKPFTLTPNPRFIFLSKHHKEAFAHLLYGINNHYGFIELIGEVGTGKTTVLRTLLAQLRDENYRFALIFNSCLTGIELLRSINSEFGIENSSEYANVLIEALNRFLIEENARGRTVVLVIDEAQNLTPEVLEQVRLISNLETEDDKLIQIILAGQPELKTVLDRPELRQLNQRIAVRYRLRSMGMSETRDYICHRMVVAGETGGVSFSFLAIRLIYLYTRGVPRMINILCDRALLVAYGDERRRITPGIVTRGIREILNLPRSKALALAVVSCAVLAALCTALVFRIPPLRLQGQTAAPVRAASTPPPASTGKTVGSPDPRSGTVRTIEHEFAALPPHDSLIQALNALLEIWKAKPVKAVDGNLVVPDSLHKLAAARGLTVTRFSGSLDDVIRLNLPFLIETRIKNPQGSTVCLAVTGLSGDNLTIIPEPGGRKRLTTAEAAALTSGTCYLLWRNVDRIPETITPGTRKLEVRALQRLLKLAGNYGGEIDGAYSDLTIRAVTDYQKSERLPVTPSLGAVTLAALSRVDRQRTVPALTGK